MKEVACSWVALTVFSLGVYIYGLVLQPADKVRDVPTHVHAGRPRVSRQRTRGPGRQTK